MLQDKEKEGAILVNSVQDVGKMSEADIVEEKKMWEECFYITPEIFSLVWEPSSLMLVSNM